MNRIGSIIESLENDWISVDILMEHRNIIHTQIDILIKQRRKLGLLQ
jgi:hypothetical protein